MLPKQKQKKKKKKKKKKKRLPVVEQQLQLVGRLLLSSRVLRTLGLTLVLTLGVVELRLF